MPSLTLTERYAVPVEALFAAWIEPEQLRRWHAPGEMTVPELSVDLRPGGRFRIVMQNSAGEQHTVVGEYAEIVPNQRLAFSWQWEGSEHHSRVSVDFKALDAASSELTLTHSGFADGEARDNHAQGWGGCFVNLRRHLATN
jgi:uncharacterized protein YndB with AHSA1/START domain